ncbi:GNAT family N-acetyltransferase [Streptomyces sp. enrichment culture]|uniref:GNAT family N-acetyltransferase n=1 Tax=Streptomyces sp. enrichment culture TaxID=1795815 RepID=UPI003F54E3DF
MPHPQPGSAPPAAAPGATVAPGHAGPAAVSTAETGADPSSDDPLTAGNGGCAAPAASGVTAARAAGATDGTAGSLAAARSHDEATEDTLDLELPHEWPELLARRAACSGPAEKPQPGTAPGELLDHPATWPAVPTAAGRFQLVPVLLARDLPLISAWMNDPAVAAFWELAGPEVRTETHLRPQVEGDGRSVPCLGVLDGTPMSYWELYRADLDPLARHFPTRPHDTGVHLLIGGVAHRGRGLGTLLLRTVADLVLDRRSRCSRMLAEPDVRNVASVAAFLGAGFRLCAEIELPGKRAALMIRDRELRHLL